MILTARDADLTGTLKIDDGIIAFWDSLESTVNWQVNDIVPGKYQVLLEYAADPSSGGAYSLDVDGRKLKGNIPVTGDWGNFMRKTLGVVNIKGESTDIELRGTSKNGLALMNVKRMVLKPIETFTNQIAHR